jgi:ABC-type glycerol-3-phosphate transport system substrate-binding protein
MKKFKKILGCSFFVILFVVAIGTTYYMLKPKHVNLGKYTWELVKDNTSIIKNSAGTIVVGPAIIILQAKYPLIYGYSDSKFIMNLKRDEILNFNKEELWQFIQYLNNYSVELNQQKFVTFGDVFPRSQHYSQYKATELKNGLWNDRKNPQGGHQ